MCTEFSGKSIALFVYQGKDICKRVKDICGHWNYQKNTEGTIRRVFGNRDMGYRTVVHSSDQNDFERELNTFKKYSLLVEL